MNWNQYVEEIGQLFLDLFGIWSYPTFGLLLLFIGIYFAVIIIRSMARLLY